MLKPVGSLVIHPLSCFFCHKMGPFIRGNVVWAPILINQGSLVLVKVFGRGKQTYIQIGIDAGTGELLKKGSEELDLTPSDRLLSLRNGAMLRGHG